MDISVVLPIYNEKENILPLLDELEGVLREIGRTYEIIAVDDGSHDGSGAILRAEAARRPALRVILFRGNAGQTAAFDAGFRAASGSVVITMDADLQNDPHDIPALLAKLDEGEGYDFVTGWRKHRRDGVVLRKIPSRIANWLIRKITGAPLPDLGCSLKVYRKHLTDEMRLYGEMHRFISVIAGSMGARVGEVVVNHRPRRAGHSKYGLRRTVKVLLDLLTVWFMRRYLTKPIYLFGGLGAAMLMGGAVVSFYVLWEKVDQGVWVHRNPLFLIAITCFLMGFQFLGTGILAEMITRTYFESQNKTAYVIAARIGFPPEKAA
jgi:glycosyltransferase involved in cell wall biosynthesis